MAPAWQGVTRVLWSVESRWSGVLLPPLPLLPERLVVLPHFQIAAEVALERPVGTLAQLSNSIYLETVSPP